MTQRAILVVWDHTKMNAIDYHLRVICECVCEVNGKSTLSLFALERFGNETSRTIVYKDIIFHI